MGVLSAQEEPIIIETDNAFERYIINPAIDFFESPVGPPIIAALIIAIVLRVLWKAIPKGVLLFVVIVVLIGVGVLKTNIGGR